MKKILFFLLITNFAYSQTLVKTYYDTYAKTTLKEVYQVKPNTPTINGYYKKYDEFGNILEERNYINNKLNGKSTTYLGANEASVTYGGINSLGKISTISNYKNGNLEGQQLRYNFSEKGKRYLEFKQEYNDNKLVSNIIYFPNGQEKKVLKIGKSSEFYENGNKFAEYIINDNEQIDGEYLGWNNYGNIEVKGFFVNGEKDGEWLEYNEDGTIKSKAVYDLGRKLPSKEEILKEEIRKKDDEKEKKERKKLELEKNQKYKLEQEQKREENRLYQKKEKLKDELYLEQELIKTKYRYWNNSSYSYEKPRIMRPYNVAIDYINAELSGKNDKEKIELYELGLRLTAKINVLMGQNSKSLEKQLKKVENPTEIINIFGVEK